LQEAEHDRLAVADQRSRDDQAGPPLAACFLPVWNQAKMSSAMPTRNEAIPCLTWWCPEPAPCPGIQEGSEPAGSAH
jgi:hypothetical protein